MKLKLKPEFLEYAIGGGKLVKRKLKNIHPSEFERLYNLGYKDFFEVSEDKTLKKVKDVVEPIKIENKDIDLDDTDK